MVLKGLPHTHPEEILQELKTKGLNPISCVQIHHSGFIKNRDLAIYRIKFPPGTSINVVSKTSFLFSVRIYWDKFCSNRKHTRCFRCQSFGHSATNCNLPAWRHYCLTLPRLLVRSGMMPYCINWTASALVGKSLPECPRAPPLEDRINDILSLNNYSLAWFGDFNRRMKIFNNLVMFGNNGLQGGNLGMGLYLWLF